MSSPTNEIVARFDFNLATGAMATVVNADELILMILEALHVPVDAEVGCISKNEKNYRRCMLVNRKWCKWGQRLLWKDLSLPQKAFDAVIQQFDTITVGAYNVEPQDRVRRRPREAYVRYCHYAALVESMRNYKIVEKEDTELYAKLDLFDLKRNVFPRLKRVALDIDPNEVWFPLSIRNHAITDFETNKINYTAPMGLVRDLSKYCSRLERLVINGRLHDYDVDLLQVHRFVYLTSLSLHVGQTNVDDFMRIILYISPNITELSLFFNSGPNPTIARRGDSFRSLYSLRLDGLWPISDCLDKLPTAPQLHSLLLTSCYGAFGESSFRISRAIEEYSRRSPFVNLQIEAFQQDTGRINIAPLSEISSLTELSLIFRLSKGILFPEAMDYMVWQQLRTLTLEFGSTHNPRITLHEFFYFASHASRLSSATVLMDIRIESNADLLSDNRSDTPGSESTRRALEDPHTLSPNIAHYRTTSLRTLDFKGTPVLFFDDQMFLLSVLRELAPMLTLSRRMLQSLQWDSKEMGDVAISYLDSSVPTMAGLISHLSNTPT